MLSFNVSLSEFPSNILTLSFELNGFPTSFIFWINQSALSRFNVDRYSVNNSSSDFSDSNLIWFLIAKN